MAKKKREHDSINPVESMLRGLSDDEQFSAKPIKIADQAGGDPDGGDLADRLAERVPTEDDLHPHPAPEFVPVPVRKGRRKGNLGLFQKIVVPVDGSPISDVVAEWSLRFAHRCGSEVVLTLVLDNRITLAGPLAPLPSGGRQARIAVAQGALDKLAADGRQAGVTVHAVLQGGDPAKAILELAQREEADLIIMAAHSRGGLERLILGSVSQAVLAEAPCLVMIYGEHGRRPLPALDDPRPARARS